MYKRIKILYFVFLVFFFSVYLFLDTSKTYAAGGTITFEDENMYNAIKEELNKKNISYSTSENLKLNITETEINKVTELTLNNKAISNITGIEQFTKLKELNLSNNAFTSIDKLSSLTSLTNLKIYGNNLSSISSLSNLTNLTSLSIGNNKITDLSPISNMTKLEYLDAHHNIIKNTSSISNLTKLKTLNLYDNLIENISGVNNLTNLEVLRLGENKTSISNLNNISYLTKLKELNYTNNSNNNILNYISNLRTLEKLDLEGNNITSISNLSNLTNLKELILYNNKISDISPLYNLNKLEYVILGKNSLTNINGIVSNNTLVWPNLKKLGINENNITINDAVNFLCTKSNNHEIELDYEKITDTSSLPHIDDNGVRYVTIDDFGARADGVYDDFIAIRNALRYAKTNNVEVRANGSKNYHVYAYYNDYSMMENNVDFNNATITIHDEEIEEKSARLRYIFTISNSIYSRRVELNNPGWTITKETKKIPELVDAVSDLKASGINQYFVLIENSNKKRFIRYKQNNSMSNGDNQNEAFLADSEGNILNDITWDYDTVTHVLIFPVLDEITIKNMNFVTNAINTQSESINRGNGKTDNYKRCVQLYTAFNVNIDNVNHTLSNDEISGSYVGFFYAQYAANLNFTNSKLFSRKYINRYTYDMYLNYGINVLFDNITMDHVEDINRWHTIVSRYSKDVTYNNCKVNVIDAHEGIQNLTIKDTIVGVRSIEVDGFGKLNIINSTIKANELMHLKEDYGSFWDGTIYVKDSTLAYNGQYALALVSFSTEKDGNAVHDYGYDLIYPNIIIENLTIDNTNNTNYQDLWLIPNWNSNTNPYIPDTYFQNDLYINGIKFINNNHISNPRLKLFCYEISQLHGNYFVTDLKLTNLNTNLTSKLNLDEETISYSDTTITINKPISFTNKVSIYKDGSLIVNNQNVNNTFERTFNENGTYRVVVTSSDDLYNHEGVKEYIFTINKIKGDHNYNGEIDITDILGSLRRHLGVENTTPDDITIFDMNGDNKISLKDVITLLKIYLGII